MSKKLTVAFILALILVFASIAFIGCKQVNTVTSSDDASSTEISVSASEQEPDSSESASASNDVSSSATEHTHAFEIIYDAEGHWQECECGYKTEKAVHTLADNYDAEGHWQECECGYKTEKQAHTLADNYDAEGHWQECECGYKTEKVAHDLVYIYDVDAYHTECACGYKSEDIAYDGYKRISAPYGYTAEGFTCANFVTSDKALTFEYKPVGDRIEGDNDYVTFSLMSGWDRMTGYISVEVVADNIASGIGTIEDVGDGWKKVTIRCSEMTLDGADGSETIDRMYFHWVNHGFLLANVDFIHVHTFTANYDAEGHWTECNCGEKTEKQAHVLEQRCDAENHWRECVCGYKCDTEAHNYTDGICDECGYELIITYQASSVIVVGDVHIGKETTNSTNLIKTLEYVKNNNIEVVIFNGDSVDVATEENYAELDRCFTLVFGDVAVADRPEFLFNMGNHEFYPTGNCDCLETVYEREYGLFRQFANKWMKEPIGENVNVYCRVIKGVYYIIAFPGNSQWASCGDYLEADFVKLKGFLDQATAIGRPCVVATHWSWGYTYGGANYGNAPDEDTAAMKALLAQYPSVINFTSHTHYSDLHERTFDQTDYTSVNVGTHCFAKYVSGLEKDENGELIVYMNIDGHKINKNVDPTANTLFWSGVTNFGIGINFGTDKIVIKRVNIGTGSDYAHGTWIVPYGIDAENKHENFYYEAGERSGETLTFAANSQLDATLDASGENVTFTLAFADVEQYYSVEGYKIEIYDANNQILYKTWWQSLFWADLGEKSDYSITVSGISVFTAYTVKVYPMDFFGVYGEPLVGNYELDLTHTVTYSASSSSYTYAEGEWSEFVAVEKWNSSKKTFSFEYKPSDTTKGFYIQLLNASGTQISEQLTITGGTLNAGHGTITDIGDGWFRYECALNGIGVNGSYGEETFSKFKIRKGNLGSEDTVKIRNVDTTKVLVHTVTYSATSSSYTYAAGEWDTFVAVENWNASNKIFSFEYKPSDTTKGFYVQLLNGSDVQISEQLTITGGTLSAGHGAITDIGDGWYRYECALSEIGVSGSNGAETFGKLKFRRGNLVSGVDTVMIRNVDTTRVAVHTVTYSASSSSYTYAAGEWVTFVAVDNWNGSDKVFSFEYKPSDTTKGFYIQLLNASGTQISEQLTITGGTLNAGHGTITDIGDGWYRYECALSDIGVSGSNGAETFKQFKIRRGNLVSDVDTVMIRNVDTTKNN